jgi:hypothetical protein
LGFGRGQIKRRFPPRQEWFNALVPTNYFFGNPVATPQYPALRPAPGTYLLEH